MNAQINLAAGLAIFFVGQRFITEENTQELLFFLWRQKGRR